MKSGASLVTEPYAPLPTCLGGLVRRRGIRAVTPPRRAGKVTGCDATALRRHPARRAGLRNGPGLGIDAEHLAS